jgi:hypothetical protein
MSRYIFIIFSQKFDKYVYNHITNVMNTTARYILGYFVGVGLPAKAGI